MDDNIEIVTNEDLIQSKNNIDDNLNTGGKRGKKKKKRSRWGSKKKRKAVRKKET